MANPRIRSARGLTRKLGLLAAPLLVAGASEAQLSVTKVSDSVIDSNALLLAKSGQWGRGINGQAFQIDPMVSNGGYQYATWYTNDAQMSVMVARRTLDGANTGDWEVVDTGSAFTRGDDTWDVHNTISIGISRNDGRLHMSWDHHVHNMRYRVTGAGIASESPSGSWDASMFGSERNYLATPGDVAPMTYPMYIETPSGDLLFAFRTGSSGNGDFRISTYANGTWSAPKIVLGKGGSYTDVMGSSSSRNGYPDGFAYGPDGKLHLTWTWRESSGGANHDINYAYSEDGGVIWKNGAGAVIANTATGDAITISDPGIIVKQLDRRQSLYNQQTMTVDTAGRVHTVVVHRRQEPGYEWKSGDGPWDPLDAAYHHYFRDPESGEWSERRLPVDVLVGTRPDIAHDEHGNLFAVYTTREAGETYKYSAGDIVIAGATAANDYNDWTILHVEELESGVGFISEPKIDRERLLRDGILSIFAQEDAPDVAGRTGTPLHVLEFAVPEPGSAAAAGLIGVGLLAGRVRP